MPTPGQILESLALAANRYYIVSIAWHILILVFLVYVLTGRKISNKSAMVLIILPLLSVAAIAFLTYNSFNGILFLVLSLLLFINLIRVRAEKVTVKWDVISAFGLMLICFGLFYPHFLDDEGFLHYLYKAPTGLIPCPTLAIVIGFTLLFHGFYHRKWMWYLSCIGLFYGVFGVVRLGVELDMVLIAGALAMIIHSFFKKK